MFWKLRKELLNHNTEVEYDIIDEGGTPLTLNKSKDLYQSREGEESHAGWTEFISESAQKATNFSTEENFNPFSTKELNKCIMKLKRIKNTGPDMIPNEAIKESVFRNEQCHVIQPDRFNTNLD
jgi:peptide methionine sulfoxide reductase MsrB